MLLFSQGDAALARRDWAAANAAFIDALWVDQAADAVNSALWLGLCTVRRLPRVAEGPLWNSVDCTLAAHTTSAGWE